MIYSCTPFKTTVKPNTALWLSLFLDVHLHVQAAVFLCGILCVRYLFFLLKKRKPHPLFLLHYYTPYYPITWLFLLQEHSTHPALLLT